MSNPFKKLVPAPQGAGTAGSVGSARPDTLGTRLHDVLHSNATLGPLFVLVLAVVVFSVTADRFLQPGNLSLIVQQVMVVGTLGIAQTLIILTAGIDLSVGAIMVLSSIVMAKLSADQGVPGLLALLVGFGVGTACGLINGLLVTRLRLPPFIVTLGTLNVFFALNLWYSESATVRGTRHVRPAAVDGQDDRHRRHEDHLRLDPDARAVRRVRVGAEEHGVGPARLRDRRRRRGRAARGRAQGPRAAQRLRRRPA